MVNMNLNLSFTKPCVGKSILTRKVKKLIRRKISVIFREISNSKLSFNNKGMYGRNLLI